MPRSIFCEKPCKRDGALSSASIICTAICTVQPTQLAAASVDRVVSFCNASGNPQPIKTIPSEANVLTMKWKPQSHNIIALGLENGTVSLWDYNSNDISKPSHCLQSATSANGSRITLLLWNDSGTHLVVGNHAGSCSLWKIDESALMQMHLVIEHRNIEYQFITEAIFFEPTQASRTNAKAKAKQVSGPVSPRSLQRHFQSINFTSKQHPFYRFISMRLSSGREGCFPFLWDSQWKSSTGRLKWPSDHCRINVIAHREAFAL